MEWQNKVWQRNVILMIVDFFGWKNLDLMGERKKLERVVLKKKEPMVGLKCVVVEVPVLKVDCLKTWNPNSLLASLDNTRYTCRLR